MIEMLHILKHIQNGLLTEVSHTFQRHGYEYFLSNKQPLGIVGERGIGKTYTLLQITKTLPHSFYFSADNSLILWQNLFEFVAELIIEHDYRAIMIDEIHMYPWRTKELKNIIDSFPQVKVVFSGSRSLDIMDGMAQLARRVEIVQMFPLNFAEYMNMFHNISLPTYSFDELMSSYKSISLKLSPQIKKQHIEQYYRYGMYPYSLGISYDVFVKKAFTNVEKILTQDLPNFINLQANTITKVKKLLYYVANTPPSDNSYTNLSKKTLINKDGLEQIIAILGNMWLIHLVYKSQNVSSALRRECKVYLSNPNLYHIFGEKEMLWSMRESFLIQSLKRPLTIRKEISTLLSSPAQGDVYFVHQGKEYYFEVGGKHKTKKQIKKKSNGFVVADSCITCEKGKIPLRLFGLLQ